MPPKQPKLYYQAVGIVEGTLTIDDDNGFPVLLTPGSFVAAYATKQVRRKHQPDKKQHFLAYPCIRKPQPPAPMVARSLTAGDTEGKQRKARLFDDSSQFPSRVRQR